MVNDTPDGGFDVESVFDPDAPGYSYRGYFVFIGNQIHIENMGKVMKRIYWLDQMVKDGILEPYS